jgi:hypothetical protein
MAIIESDNTTLKATAYLEEGKRQAAVAAAKSAGNSAAIQAAVVAAEITYYRAIVAAAKANGQQHAQFIQALTWMGASP